MLTSKTLYELEVFSTCNRVDVLWESSDEIFVLADPEVNRFIHIEEINLLEM